MLAHNKSGWTLLESSARDKNMKPAADDGFILMSKEL